MSFFRHIFNADALHLADGARSLQHKAAALSRRVCIPSAMAVSRSAPVSQRWEIIVRIRGVISMIS